eukprot:scaffold657443_cov42-Prasinocladus_malaysianus.AAC.1
MQRMVAASETIASASAFRCRGRDRTARQRAQRCRCIIYHQAVCHASLSSAPLQPKAPDQLSRRTLLGGAFSVCVVGQSNKASGDTARGFTLEDALATTLDIQEQVRQWLRHPEK